MGKNLPKKNVLISMIARELGLSPGTISIVLNGRGDEMRISKATQTRVKEYAKELGYQPNIYARRLRASQNEPYTYVIAIFWNSGYADEIMGAFFRNLQHYALEKEYHVEFYLYMYEYDQLKNSTQLLTSSRFSGAIICGASDEDSKFLNEHKFNIPIVSAFRREIKYSSVYVNNYDVGTSVANLFGRKHKTIVGYIGSKQNAPNSNLRKTGYLDRSIELSIQVNNEMIIEVDGKDFDAGYEAMEKLIKQSGDKAQAVFVNGPDLALGAVAACKRNEIIFEKDLQLVAAGSTKIFEHFYPTITYVNTPVEEFASNSLGLLMMEINNRIEPPLSKVLKPQYVIGKTCAFV